MKKIAIALIGIFLLQSCETIQPIWDQYFGKKEVKDPNSEEVILDQQPPAGYDPIFILGEKGINGIVNDPKMTISRVEANPQKVKVYFHLVDESLLMQGGSDLKDIWCEVTDTINGKAMEISNFKIKEITEDDKRNLAIAMVMDHSGSMGNPRAKVMQEAVAEFIRKKFPTDLVSLIRYDHRTIVKTPPLPNELDLLMEHEINGISQMGGGTKTIAALDKAIDELKDLEGDYQKVAMVFTDGINSDLNGFDALIKKAQDNNVIISGVDYGYNITPNFLDVIANRTNGIYHHIYKTNEFKLVFDDLYYRMNNYYVLEYDNPGIGEHSIYIKTCLEQDTIEASYDYQIIPKKGEVVILNVYFDTGKSELKKASETAISTIEQLMKSSETMEIRIVGHTDNVGKEEDNQILSQKRVQSVKNELVDRGISASRILVSGVGEKEPIADNNTTEGRAKNRRVEFEIIKE